MRVGCAQTQQLTFPVVVAEDDLQKSSKKLQDSSRVGHLFLQSCGGFGRERPVWKTGPNGAVENTDGMMEVVPG